MLISNPLSSPTDPSRNLSPPASHQACVPAETAADEGHSTALETTALETSRNHQTLHPPISILLISDDPSFYGQIESLLTIYRSTAVLQGHIVAAGPSLDEALEALEPQVTSLSSPFPDMVLLDLDMGNSTGIDVLLHQQQSQSVGPILAVSTNADDAWIYQVMRAGAKGYLCKSEMTQHLPQAIATITHQDIYLSLNATTAFFRMFNRYAGRSLHLLAKPSDRVDIHLTEREQDVLSLVVEGQSNEHIAQHLYITVGTVKCYLTTIFNKLGVKSRTQAAMKAIKLGLIAV